MSQFKARRHFYFRQIVALTDVVICQKGNGPMALAWSDARYFWRCATVKARNEENQLKHFRG